MRSAPSRAIGILAGGGNLPIEIAASLRARGARVTMIAFSGEANAALDALEPTYVQWGQIGRIVKTLKAHGCKRLLTVGSVRRPDLGAIKPDLGFFKALPAVIRLIRAGGDDAVLRGVIAFFESKDIEIVSPATVAPELIINEGPFGDVSMPEQLATDVALGFAAIRALAPFDVGQSVVVTRGRVEAIEAADGTDAMLNRTAARRRQLLAGSGHPNAHGVLVKRPKPGQDLRIDLPVIGPATAMRCVETNLSGIAVEAGRVLAVERDEMKAFASAHQIFIEGVREDPSASRRTSNTQTSGKDKMDARTVGRVKASRQSRKDAVRGCQLIAALEPFAENYVAVLSRGHVLSIDDSERRGDVIARASQLRQWGDRRWTRRFGVAVLSAGRDADTETLKSAAQAGLACVAVRLRKFAATVPASMIKIADDLGLALIEVYPGEGP